MKMTFFPITLGLSLFLHAAPAEAQLSITWVSETGPFGASCSRSQPCFDFQAAHDQTLDGGEIRCIDSGPFGGIFGLVQLTITKSITIDCTGTASSINTEATGILINTPDVVVTLRGLSITGHPGTVGIDNHRSGNLVDGAATSPLTVN